MRLWPFCYSKNCSLTAGRVTDTYVNHQNTFINGYQDQDMFFGEQGRYFFLLDTLQGTWVDSLARVPQLPEALWSEFGTFGAVASSSEVGPSG